MTSIFTDDLTKCFFTGTIYKEVHHIFAGSRRKKCEKYGYVIPINIYLHPNGASKSDMYCKMALGKNLKELDIYLKQECQKDFEKNHGTRQDFITEFGKSYL